MAKQNSLEKLLQRKRQRASLDLPDPNLNPVATPVETGYPVPLAPYMSTDDRRAAASLVKGLETFNRGLVGVAEQINDEMMKELALKEGEAISEAADKYLVFENNKPLWVTEDLPGTKIAKGQNLSPDDAKDVAAAIDEEVTQRRGYPKQREKALKALEEQGIDIDILPSHRRLFELEEARKFSGLAREHIDNATAALVEPDSKLTVEHLIVEAMQGATGDKSLTWAGILAMSPAISQEIQDLKNKKEQRLLPAKSEARQAMLEEEAMTTGRRMLNEALGLLVKNSPQDAIKAQALFRDMFLAITSSRDTQGLQGGPRIRRQLFKEAEKRILQDIANGTLETETDAREAMAALEIGRDLAMGTGTEEPLLKVTGALPTSDPNEETPIMPDPVKQAGEGGDHQAQIREEVGKGNTPPETTEPVGTPAYNRLQYALAKQGETARKIPERAARFARNLLLNPAAFTTAGGKKVDMEGWTKSHPDYLTKDWDNDDLSKIVTQAITSLEQSDTSLGQSYTTANELEKQEYRAAIIRAMRKYIDGVQKETADANTQVDADRARTRGEEAYTHRLRMRKAELANVAHQEKMRSRDDATYKDTLWTRQKKVERVEHEESERELGLLLRLEEEEAGDTAREAEAKYHKVHLAQRELGHPDPNKAAEAAAKVILNKLVENPDSPNHGDPVVAFNHPRRAALKELFAADAAVDTFMQVLASAAERYGQGTPEYGNSPNPGEAATGATLMPSSSSIRQAFMKYEERAPEFQRRWTELVKDRATYVYKDPDLRKLFHATPEDRRAAALDTQRNIITTALENDLKEIHEEGEAYLRQKRGIADSLAPKIYNIQTETNEQSKEFYKAGGVFQSMNAQVGSLTPTDLISLFSSPEDREARKSLVDQGVLDFSIPMHRAINQIGRALATDDFSFINGWNDETNSVTIKRSDTGHEIELRPSEMRKFHHLAVQAFGLPRRQWLADGNTMELTDTFVSSPASAATTPLFEGQDALDSFQKAYGDEGWTKLHEALKKENKLGALAVSGQAPSPDELKKIQTRLAYKAGRLAAPFHATDTIVRQTASYESLGWVSRRYITDEGQRDPMAAQQRQIHSDALTRELPPGSVREKVIETPAEVGERRSRRGKYISPSYQETE